MNPEPHIAGVISNSGIGMRGSVIEELDNAFNGFGGSGILLGREGVDGEQHGIIDGTGVEEESAEDFLDAMNSCSINGRGLVGERFQLGNGAVSGRCPRMGGILGMKGRGMFKAVERFFDVPWHGEITSASVVIPIKSDAAEDFGIPIDGGVVLEPKGRNKELSVCAVSVAHKKVINNQTEEE